MTKTANSLAGLQGWVGDRSINKNLEFLYLQISILQTFTNFGGTDTATRT